MLTVGWFYLLLFVIPFSFQIRHRGMWPAGSGEVYFSCPVVKRMKAMVMVEEGKVRRVRGIAYPLLLKLGALVLLKQ